MLSGYGEPTSGRRRPHWTTVTGAAPFLPYLAAVEPPFPLSDIATGLAFFSVGATRSLVTARPWDVNGAEMLVVGMAAAVVAFVVGSALKGIA